MLLTALSHTVAAVPTPSRTPSEVYDFSNPTELSDAVASAEQGREWILAVTNDIAANGTLVLSSNTRIKIVGSSMLELRARITSGSADYPQAFLSYDNIMLPPQAGGEGRPNNLLQETSTGNVTPWVENLAFSGFGRVIDVSHFSSLTVENCGFSANDQEAIVVWGPHSTAFVRGSKFAGNWVGVDVKGPDSTVFVHGSEFVDHHGIHFGYASFTVGDPSDSDTSGNAVVITSTVFARNSAPNGAAVLAWSSFPQLPIRNCTMFDNDADHGRPAVYAYGETFGATIKNVTLEYSLLYNNTAQKSGGAVMSWTNT